MYSDSRFFLSMTFVGGSLSPELDSVCITYLIYVRLCCSCPIRTINSLERLLWHFRHRGIWQLVPLLPSWLYFSLLDFRLSSTLLAGEASVFEWAGCAFAFGFLPHFVSEFSLLKCLDFPSCRNFPVSYCSFFEARSCLSCSIWGFIMHWTALLDNLNWLSYLFSVRLWSINRDCFCRNSILLSELRWLCRFLICRILLKSGLLTLCLKSICSSLIE